MSFSFGGETRLRNSVATYSNRDGRFAGSQRVREISRSRGFTAKCARDRRATRARTKARVSAIVINDRARRREGRKRRGEAFFPE